MSDHLHHHRDLPPSATSSVSDGLVDSTGGGGVHLENVMRDAERRLNDGDWNEGLRSLVHCIFVAGTTDHKLSELELLAWTNRLFSAGCLRTVWPMPFPGDEEL